MMSHQWRWRVTVLGGLVCLWLARPGWSQTPGCGYPPALEPVAYESLTVSTVAIGPSPSLFNTVSATAAWITVEAQPLRYKLSGAPTATDGHLVEPPSQGNADAGNGAWFCGQKALTQLRFIRASTADSTVRITYFRLP